MALKIFKIILLIFGIALCGFALFFIVTGSDELWNGQKLWLYGIGVAGLLGTIGVSSIIISLNSKNKAPRVLFYLTIFFIFLTIISFFFS